MRERDGTSGASDSDLKVSSEHEAYIMQLRDTLDLDPVPFSEPAGPYNGPIWKVIGEQAAGPLSDHWMQLQPRRNRKHGEPVPSPDWRLWMPYIGCGTATVGLVVLIVQIAIRESNGYNVTPIIGSSIAAFGKQIVTTVRITYAVDCHDRT